VLDERIEACRQIFQRYYEALSEYDGIEFMPEAQYGRSTRWLTTLTVNPNKAGCDRTQIIEALEKENIEARPVWKPMHMQPLYKDAEFVTTSVGNPVSEALFETGLCLPSGSGMTQEDQDRVIGVVKECLEGNGKDEG